MLRQLFYLEKAAGLKRESCATCFAGMWQREFNSGLDPTLNRMYHSRLFRWMSANPRPLFMAFRPGWKGTTARVPMMFIGSRAATVHHNFSSPGFSR